MLNESLFEGLADLNDTEEADDGMTPMEIVSTMLETMLDGYDKRIRPGYGESPEYAGTHCMLQRTPKNRHRMVRHKSKLVLGKRSKTTKFRRRIHQIPLRIRTAYVPTTPVVKVKRFFTPQGKKGLKRTSLTSPRQKSSPFKSPFKKKSRQSTRKLFDSSDGNIVEHPVNELEHSATHTEIFANHKEEEIQQFAEVTGAVKEMISLVPSVLSSLKKEGLDKQMLDFFRLVHDGLFPLDNIALLLWLELVKWYSTDNAVHMRYSAVTKKFWKLGYRNFGGRFVNFMSGFKLSSCIIGQEAEKGLLSTKDSKVNFAVPSVNVLRSFDPYNVRETKNDTCSPGIFVNIIETLSETLKGKSCCITFDGKKLKQGLTKTDGDVDLLGFEKGETLSSKKEEHANLVKPVQNLLEELRDSEIDNVLSLPEHQKKDLTTFCKYTLREVSRQVLNVRELKKKKEYARDKLIERSDTPIWKNGRYAYAISAAIAFLYDIDVYLKNTYSLIDEIVKCICCVQGSRVLTESELDLDCAPNYQTIENTNTINDTRKVKQRSDAWFTARKEAMVTGSSIYRAIGLESLKQQKEYFDEVVCKLPQKEKSEKVKEFMKYGTENEPNAMATIVGKVAPLLYPEGVVAEEGYVEYGSYNNKPFLIVSPDGSIQSTDDGSTAAAIELKCPVQDVHSELPPRYLLQCLCEIEALEVSQLLYLSWKPDISSVFIVHRNKQLFEKAYNVAQELYATESPKRCNKISESTKSLREDISNACRSKETVEFQCIVPSLKHTGHDVASEIDVGFSITRLLLMTESLLKSYSSHYELKRQPASEAVVFVLCDLDRSWRENSVRSAPICWFPKGYSLDTDTMRCILETVLDICKEKDIHVPAVSFDGQWHTINVRDTDGEALTLYQLQRDVWKKVEKMSKNSILNEIKCMNTETAWNSVVVEEVGSEKVARKVLRAEYVSCSLPTISSRIFQRKQVRVEENTDAHFVDEINSESLLVQIDGVSLNDEEQPVQGPSSKTIDQETSEIPRFQFSNEDAATMLKMMRLDEKANQKGQWTEKCPADIITALASTEGLTKLRDVELKIVARYVNSAKLNIKIRESSSKRDKIMQLCALLCLHDTSTLQPCVRKKKVQQLKSLSDLAFEKVSKMKKSELNVVYAESIWHREFKRWKSEKCTVTAVEETTDMQILPENWFYYPYRSSSREQIELSCVDSSHLLTRTRRKICRGGIEGLSNAPWKNAAKGELTSLTLAMVDAVLEPMSVSVANSHFDEDVEMAMRANGDVRAADLCKDIRQWWYAEDNPGIASKTRIELRKPLRDRLMSYVNFEHFPPRTQYVNGWPVQLWEAIIANIDAKTLLYGLSNSHSYNVRSFSSMMGETFFSELTMFDKRGQGTVTVTEFGQFISTTCEALNMRLDPERTFYYRTSRKSAYNLADKTQNVEQTTPKRTLKETKECQLTISDHFFDSADRVRRKGKKKTALYSEDRNAVKRGSLGVRWESARRNESKLLPTLRMGLEDELYDI